MLLHNLSFIASKSFVDNKITYYGNLVVIENNIMDITVAYKGYRVCVNPCYATGPIVYLPAEKIIFTLKISDAYDKCMPPMNKMNIKPFNFNMLSCGYRRDVFADGQQIPVTLNLFTQHVIELMINQLYL